MAEAAGEQQLEELTKRYESLETDLSKAVDEFRKQVKKLDDGEEMLKRLVDQWDDLEKVPVVNQRIQKLQEELDETRTRLNRGGIAGSGGDDKDAEVRAAFFQWARRGDRATDAVRVLEERGMATDDNAQGGYFIPEPVRQAIIERLREVNPLRELSDVVTVSVGEGIEIPEEDGDLESGWVGEREERPETQAPTFGMHRISLREEYAYPHVTQKMLDDSAFDVEGYLAQRIARRLREREGQAFISGDGVTRPMGILAEPASRVKRVKTGHASEVTADGLIDLIYELPSEFAPGMSVILNRKTIRELRKLKDSQNQYLWQPSLQAGEPSTFAGVPLREATQMPEVAADAEIAIAGNFREGYTIADKSTVGMLRDPYTKKPWVGFYTTRRVGGKVTQAKALAIQEVKA